jgi:hypothetical protein
MCIDCNREHESLTPCPRRIANALLGQPGGVLCMLPSDHDWIIEHPDFKVLEVIEEELADRLPN